MAASNDNTCVALIGNSLISKSPLFSLDSKYLFVVSGKNVLVYSTSSGECVRKLNAQNEVVSIFINPRNHLQLATCANHGTNNQKNICDVVFWDFVDGIRHKNYKINRHVDALWMPNSDGIVYYLSKRNKLIQFDNLFDETGKRQQEKSIFSGIDNYKLVAVGLNGEYLVNIAKNRIFVHFPRTNLSTKHVFYSTKNKFTSVATHPAEYCIATGNDVGKIFLWYNIDTNNFVKTSLHWHQLPVSSICFTGSGTQLLSGGGECVLVKWNTNQNTPDFLPRLGMPICDVVSSQDGALIATCHVDNSINLVNNHDRIVQVIQGLTQGHHWKELNWDPNPIGLIFDPISSSLVLNGKPGHVQFYSLKEDKQLFNLDITCQNYHHRERNFNIYITEVWRAACDVSGNWLATVEFRDVTDTSLEIKLKFWMYRRDLQNHELNTTVELPHTRKVNSLKFAPRSKNSDVIPLCVTTSDDKRFKIWTLSEDDEGKSNWKCDSVGYYREVEAGNASFNDDGSTLGVVFNHAVTLWNPETNALKGTLYDPKSKLKIEQIEFGVDQFPQLLISVTKESIVTWNLVTSSVEARLEMKDAVVARDPSSQFMIAFDGEDYLNVFLPEKLEIVKRKKLFDNDGNFKKIICAIFVENQDGGGVEWGLKSKLYFMDRDLNLYTLRDRRERVEDEEDNERVKMVNNLPFTPIGMLLNQQQLKVQKSKRKKMAHVENVDVVGDLFTSSSNMMPNPRQQCILLHEQLLQKRSKNDERPTRVKKDEIDAIFNEENGDDDEESKQIEKINDVDVVKKEKILFDDISEFNWLSALFKKL